LINLSLSWSFAEIMWYLVKDVFSQIYHNQQSSSKHWSDWGMPGSD
jgi:hypothetical protein